MKKAHIIGFVIIIICISVIIYTYTESSTYNTFTQAAKANKEVYVLSKLDTAFKIYYDPLKDPNFMYFYSIDSDNHKSKVIFYGPKPQDFERSEQVVMLGKFSKEENAFIAIKLLLKCPSKYTEEMPSGFAEKEFSSDIKK